MRANTACQNMIPVDKQVMCCQRRRNIVAAIAYIGDAIRRCHMFHHNPKGGDTATQRIKDTLDKDSFTVKNINLRVSHLPMHAQRQAGLGHGLKDRNNLVNVADTRGRVGGRTRRIELNRCHQP